FIVPLLLQDSFALFTTVRNTSFKLDYESWVLRKFYMNLTYVFIVTKEIAEAYATKGTTAVEKEKEEEKKQDEEKGPVDRGKPKPSPEPQNLPGFTWSGEVPAQKWMNFYTRVL